jgi:hypothetical protein
VQTTRAAKPEDIPYLLERLKESGGETIDLWKTPAWIVEEPGVDGTPQILGLLAIRLVWQMEPMYVFPEVKNKASRRRACALLYNAAEDWLRNRELNGSGIYWAFAILRKVGVRSWAKAMGWRHQYKRAPMYIKHF